jgi:hypothetical protein
MDLGQRPDELVEGRAARFGTQEPWYFLQAIWGQWHWLTLPIVLLAMQALGNIGRCSNAAIFNLAFISVIGHKEYRFIELTSAALVLLAAIGRQRWRWLEQDEAYPIRRSRRCPACYWRAWRRFGMAGQRQAARSMVR